MKKLTMWMVLMAMAVSPLFAQEGEPSEITEQQVEQAIEEALAGEALAGEALAGEATDEQQVEQAIEEALGESAETETVVFESDEPGAWEEIQEPEIQEPDIQEPDIQELEMQEAEMQEAEMQEAEMQEPEMQEPEMQEPEHKSRPQYREIQTLMKGGGGGYGAISIGYTEINNLPSLQIGAHAEWVMGHGFGLGIAGTGFTSDFTTVGTDYYALSGGYGGLVMEPIILGWLPVHIALPIVIGGGGVASYATNSDPWDYDNLDPTFGEYAVFFIAEAGVELEFNLVRFFRLSLFGTYRWTTDLEMKPMYGLGESSPYHVGPHALHGWSTGVRFKFGSF
ncbi:MAG: hypothetical protein V2B15_00065 [Bacteroidota bacterium]